MRHRLIPLAALVLALTTPAIAAKKVPAAALIAAAKTAKLAEIDTGRKDCADGRTVAAWLKQAIGPTARSITWKAGRCILVIPENPIDAGGHWCAHAEILPKKGRKRATIEVYLEEPKAGKPGVPYAFRAETDLRDGGSDYSRDTISFEYNWRQAHEPHFADETKVCAPPDDGGE